MLFSIIHFLQVHSSRARQMINLVGQQPPGTPVLTAELEGSCIFSLNSLMSLYPILVVYGPKALQPVALTLLIYTISLRLATNTPFLRDHSTVSRLLHAIPLLGTSCMASIALVSHLQSPALAVVGLILGVLPLVTIVIHEGIVCANTSTVELLPVRMEHLPAPAESRSADTTVVAH